MTGRNAHFESGARQTNVPLEQFGFDVVDGGEERHLRKFHEPTSHPVAVSRVRLTNLRAGQHHVDYDPAFRRDPDIDAMQPVRAVSLPDGKMQLRDGHHRAVEAKLRGESSIDVEHLGYGYGRCYMPPCEYGHP